MQRHPHNSQNKGIVIILALLIITTISAIVFAISYSTQGSLRQSQLEQEEERKLREAQSKLEEALQNNIDERVFKGINEVGAVQTYNPPANTSFTTPLLKGGDLFTLYLVPIESGIGGGIQYKAADTNLNVTMSPAGGACLEFTIMGRRADIGPEGVRRVYIGNCSALENVTPIATNPAAVPIGGGQVAFVRVVTGSTQLTFDGPIAQQKDTQFAASTDGGVQKDVSVYKSQPQLPINFFVTSF